LKGKLGQVCFRVLHLAAASAALFVGACRDPERRFIGTTLSEDGTKALTLHHEVRGSIMDDSLVLTLAPPSKALSAEGSVAGIKAAKNLRAYWDADGSPVIVADYFNGWINSEPPGPTILVCIGRDKACAHFSPPAGALKVNNYRSGESGPWLVKAR